MRRKWKRISAAVLSFAMVMGNMTYAAPAASRASKEDLVFYSNFDDETVTDLSGNGNNGTIHGGITFVDGIKGKAMYVNNTGKQAGDDNTEAEQYVDLGTNVTFGTEDFTLSFWVKTDGHGTTNSAIMGNKVYKNGSNLGWAIGNFTGASYGPDLRINFSATGTDRIEVKEIKANDDAWHHVAAVYDRDGDMTVYLDGEKASSASMKAHAGKSVDTGLPVILGASGNKMNGMGRCALDEVRMYRRALNAGEIQGLYQEIMDEIGVEDLLNDGLVMHSTFDEGDVSGNKVLDVTGRGNDGAMNGTFRFEKGMRGNAIALENQDSAGKNSQAEQYVDYGQTEDLKFGTGDFSIAFWMKTKNNGQNNGCILSNKDYASGSNVGWAFGNFNNPNDVDIRMNFSGNKGSRVELKKIPANDNAWHHVVGTYDRDGDMTLYLDGEKFSSASMASHSGKTADTGLPFILGGDGRSYYGMKDCLVDELRVYKKALPASTVSALYGTEGVTAVVEGLEEQLAAIKPGSEYPQADIDAMAKRIAEVKASLDGVDMDEALKAVQELQKEFDRFLEGSEPLASFQVVSDVHIKENNLTHENAVNFIAGLEDIKALDPDSLGLLNLGDFTQDGKEAQYLGLYNIMDQYGPFEDEKNLIALGNHDVRGSQGQWNKDETVESAYWQTAKTLYLENNARYMPENDGKVYFDRWLGGYHFIVLNTENGLKDAMYLSDEQLTWLEETLAENASPEKPIFVLGHNALNDTHWRSNILNGFGNQDAKVKEIFKKYPQVIYMSGHIHNGFGTTEVIDREFGTMVDLPSYNDSENGVTADGTGYHVKIYEDSVVFKARNFKTSTWLPEYDVTVKLPGLPAVYKQAKAVNPDDYTMESYQKVSDLMKEIEGIYGREYDQSGLTWDKVDAPDESLFTKEVRSQILDLTNQLKVALAGLEESGQTLPVVKDTYLQGGSDADKVGTAYSNYDANKLRVKFSDGDQSYTRKTLLTFDISKLDETAEIIELVLQLTPGLSNTNPAKDFTSADVYQVSNDWDAASVTWNTSPERIGDKPAGVITKGSVSNGFVNVEVTEAVKAAKAAGESMISFEITCPTEANDNMIDFWSSRAAGYQAPRMRAGKVDTSKPVDPEFVALREKWLKNLLGGQLDTSNDAVNTYITNINEKANGYWKTMHKSQETNRFNLWDDLDMTFISGTGAAAKVNSGNVANTFYRLKDMAIAWATKGCDLYQNETLKDELIKALDFMNQNHYSSSDSQTPFFGNWWHWEIGAPIAFMDTALILYDELTLRQIQNYAAAVNRFTDVCDKPSGYPGSPAMTGANLIDKGMAVAQVGLLTDNADKLAHVKKAYKTVFQYVTSGDGFYEDGSFIQHQALAYMGGYGSQLYEKLSILFSVFAGSDYELVYDDHAEQILFDMVFEGIEPFIYDGLCMDMISGRDITRNTAYDKKRGAKLLDAMMLLGDAMPEDQKARFESMVKYYVGIDEEFYYGMSSHIASLMKANEIMNDDSIEPRSDYAIHKLFASMDKLVHIMPGYGLGLSMHSNRTYGHELINDEGKRTWNISDGMTYLYNGDRDQYGEGYWATVDPKRLSGTTTEYVTRPNGAGDRTKNIYSWVGGSSLGLYGSAGMHFKTLGNSGSTRNGTDAKKSWFMFDDEIVAVGSGITSTTGNYVETIIDNRKLRKDGTNVVTADGEVREDIRDDGAENVTKGTKLSGTSWLHLEGNAENSDIGYFFPGKADIMALKEKRTGNWSAQGTTEGEETNQFATFWFEHGQKPTNADYAYVILPGKDTSATEDYAAQPDIEILENSTDVHAVRENTLGITAVNFWNSKSKAVAGISSDKPASVIVQTEGSQVTVGVSDPTQEENGSIQISLPYAAGDVVSADANVTVLQKTPFIKLSVDVKGTVGQTSAITMEVIETENREIVGLTGALEPVKAAPGTKFADLNLPETVEVYDNQGSVHTLSITWNRGDYNKDQYGTYDLEGDLTLTEGLFNTAGIKATVQVIVQDDSTVTTDDVYVQGGTDGDKNFSGSTSLILKYDKGAQSYTRKSLMKFDLSQVPEDAEEIWLTFELTGTPSVDFTIAEIYAVESDWSGSSVTFNTFPKRIDDEPAASFTMEMAKAGNVQKLDVTKAVRDAQARGEEAISFELSIPTAAGNNYVGIHSSRATKEGVVKPSLVFDSNYEAETIVKKNLRFLTELAADIDPAEFTNVDEARLGQLLAQAEEILADADAGMDEIHETERLLTKELARYRRK